MVVECKRMFICVVRLLDMDENFFTNIFNFSKSPVCLFNVELYEKARSRWVIIKNFQIKNILFPTFYDNGGKGEGEEGGGISAAIPINIIGRFWRLHEALCKQSIFKKFS